MKIVSQCYVLLFHNFTMLIILTLQHHLPFLYVISRSTTIRNFIIKQVVKSSFFPSLGITNVVARLNYFVNYSKQPQCTAFNRLKYVYGFCNKRWAQYLLTSILIGTKQAQNKFALFG